MVQMPSSSLIISLLFVIEGISRSGIAVCKPCNFLCRKEGPAFLMQVTIWRFHSSRSVIRAAVGEQSELGPTWERGGNFPAAGPAVWSLCKEPLPAHLGPREDAEDCVLRIGKFSERETSLEKRKHCRILRTWNIFGAGFLSYNSTGRYCWQDGVKVIGQAMVIILDISWDINVFSSSWTLQEFEGKNRKVYTWFKICFLVS